MIEDTFYIVQVYVVRETGNRSYESLHYLENRKGDFLIPASRMLPSPPSYYPYEIRFRLPPETEELEKRLLRVGYSLKYQVQKITLTQRREKTCSGQIRS